MNNSASADSLQRPQNEQPPVKVRVKDTANGRKVILKNNVRPLKPRVKVIAVTDTGKNKQTVKVKGKKRVVALPETVRKVKVKQPGGKPQLAWRALGKPKQDNTVDVYDNENVSVTGEPIQAIDRDNWTCEQANEPIHHTSEADLEWVHATFEGHCATSLGTIREGRHASFHDGENVDAYEEVGMHDCDVTAERAICTKTLKFATAPWLKYGRKNVVINGQRIDATSGSHFTTSITYEARVIEYNGEDGYIIDTMIPNGTPLGSFQADPVGTKHRPAHWEATSIGLPAGATIPVVLHQEMTSPELFWEGRALANRLGAFTVAPINCGVIYS